MSIFRIFTALFLVLLTSCECAEETLTQTCPVPEPCFVAYGKDNVEANIIKGEMLSYYVDQACTYGETVCDEDFNITCEGYSYPQAEICDGKDNNCDGVIDNQETLRLTYWDSENPCWQTEVGVCRYAEAVCSNGEWLCIKPEEYGEEVCDNKDNDCDGEVDEDIEERFVYAGPPETLNVGECRAGVEYCDDGQWRMFGMRTPIGEICGNDDDDDCDGFVDETDGPPGEYDFLLIIDVSGSMDQYLVSVSNAICSWSTNSLFQNSKFAVVAVGDSDFSSTIGVVTDFATAGEVCHTLSEYLSNTSGYGSFEFQTDAVYYSISTQDPVVNLHWTGRQKKMVIFSDEELQYGQGINGISNVLEAIQFIKESCSADNYSVSAFVNWNTTDYIRWLELTSSCAGYLEFLSPIPEVMVQNLNYWFGEEC